MLITLREQLHREHPGGGRWERLAYGLWARMLRSPRLYRFATWAASRTVGRFARRRGWLRRLPPGLRGWTRTRDFPAPAGQRFRDWWRRHGRTGDESGRPA
jgi:L-lactate dehydrogenase complex protein LldF